MAAIDILWLLLAFVGSYLIGSMPSSVWFGKILKGKDVREHHTKNPGGMNAVRTFGLAFGLFILFLDIFKGALTIALLDHLFSLDHFVAMDGSNIWHTLACIIGPGLCVLGHNYSIFMLGRDKEGKLRIGGGAGGATCLGGSFGLWAPGGWIIVLMGMLIFWFVGYASVVTMSFAFLSIIIFSIRAFMGISPWVYAVYGLLAEILLMIALRPNIKRLLDGSERLHGYRRRRRKKPRV